MSRRYRKPGFSVDDLSGTRFELAMERLRSGEAFEFREVTFYIGADGTLHCMVESSWKAENVTPRTVDQDLGEGDAALRYLMAESSEFSAAVGERPICYELIEDYGMGSILICSRKDGITEWAHGVPRGAS